MEFVIRTPEQLAQVLKGFRQERGLTQRELGERAGLLQKAISGMEHSPETSSIERLFRLVSGLEVELVLRHRPKPISSKKSEW